MKNQSLIKILKSLPEIPGVYRFYSDNGILLYIGKAKNLKRRVNSYFQKNHDNPRITKLVSKIFHIEYTLTKNEEESLILEANLIHSLQPKYNILLKDDKSYIYLKFSSDPIPGIFITRRKTNSKDFYLGPYTKSQEIYQVLRVLRTIYPFCQNRKKSQKPCKYVSIGQCLGVCSGQEKMDDYIYRVNTIKEIFQGNFQILEKELKNRIQTSIQVENFALAAFYRDTLEQAKKIIQSKKTSLNSNQNYTLVSILESKLKDSLIFSSTIQEVVAGRVVNVMNFLQTGLDLDTKKDTKNSVVFDLLKQVQYQNPYTDKILIKWIEEVVEN